MRSGAGVVGLALQPFAIGHDIAHGLAGVPGQLADAAGHVGQAFQAESGTAAGLELTPAVEKTANAAGTTLSAVLLAKGGAKIIEESWSGRTKAAPVETAPRPVNDYDAGAWEAYYRAHPDEMRSVGAGGARLPDDALVCRGGTCTAERFEHGKGVKID